MTIAIKLFSVLLFSILTASSVSNNWMEQMCKNGRYKWSLSGGSCTLKLKSMLIAGPIDCESIKKMNLANFEKCENNELIFRNKTGATSTVEKVVGSIYIPIILK